MRYVQLDETESAETIAFRILHAKPILDDCELADFDFDADDLEFDDFDFDDDEDLF